MLRILISYRRNDLPAMAVRIFEKLADHFGEQSVFMDVDTLKPGEDFRKRINDFLDNCNFMVVIIGPRWLGPKGRGRFRIHEEADWVRIEVETALRRKVWVIPVCVGDANMPKGAQLPESIREFQFHHALEVDTLKDFSVHVGRLIRAIEQIEEERRTRSAEASIDTEKSGSVATGPADPDSGVRTPASEVTSSPPAVMGAGTSPPENISVAPIAAEPRAPVKVEEPPPPPPPVSKKIEQPETGPAVEASSPSQSGPSNEKADSTIEAPSGETALAPPPIAKPTPSGNSRRRLAAAVVGLLLGAGLIYLGVPRNQPPPSRPSNQAAPVPTPASGPKTATFQPRPETEVATTPRAERPKPTSAATCESTFFATDVRIGGGPAATPAIVPIFGDNAARAAMKLRALALSPDGRMIATAGDDRVIRLWDASSFRQLAVLSGHTGAIYSLNFWTDGSLLASASLDNSIRIWDLASRSSRHVFQARSPQYAVAFYPGQALRYVNSGGEDGTIWIWSVPANKLDRERHGHQSSTVRSLSFAPNPSGEFVSAGYDGKINFYFGGGGRSHSVNAYRGKALSVEYSPDASRVLAAGADAARGNLKVWNGKDRSLIRTYNDRQPHAVAASWSRDGTQIASGGGGDYKVRLWDVESARELRAFAGHEKDVEGVVFHPNRSRVVSISEDGTMKVWNANDGRLLLTSIGFSQGEFLAYTPGGCYTGSPNIDGRFRIAVDNKERAATPEERHIMFAPSGFAQLINGR